MTHLLLLVDEMFGVTVHGPYEEALTNEKIKGILAKHGRDLAESVWIVTLSPGTKHVFEWTYLEEVKGE
jgi:hypothetical protein